MSLLPLPIISKRRAVQRERRASRRDGRAWGGRAVPEGPAEPRLLGWSFEGLRVPGTSRDAARGGARGTDDPLP